MLPSQTNRRSVLRLIELGTIYLEPLSQTLDLCIDSQSVLRCQSGISGSCVLTSMIHHLRLRVLGYLPCSGGTRTVSKAHVIFRSSLSCAVAASRRSYCDGIGLFALHSCLLFVTRIPLTRQANHAESWPTLHRHRH